jgi:hypothetical protein
VKRRKSFLYVNYNFSSYKNFLVRTGKWLPLTPPALTLTLIGATVMCLRKFVPLWDQYGSSRGAPLGNGQMLKRQRSKGQKYVFIQILIRMDVRIFLSEWSKGKLRKGQE